MVVAYAKAGVSVGLFFWAVACGSSSNSSGGMAGAGDKLRASDPAKPGVACTWMPIASRPRLPPPHPRRPRGSSTACACCSTGSSTERGNRLRGRRAAREGSALVSHPRLVIVVATLAAYATSLGGPFQFEDFGVIVDYQPVHSLGAWWAAAGHGLRPLLKFTYALNWTIGASAIGFHLFNLLVHLGNVELAMRLYVAASRVETGTGALAAGLLFAVHPVQTEAVTYVSGRSSSLMTLFALLALLAYVEGVRSKGVALGCDRCTLFRVRAAHEGNGGNAPRGAAPLGALVRARARRGLFVRQAVWRALLLALVSVAIMQRRYFGLLYDSSRARAPWSIRSRIRLTAARTLLSRLFLVHRLSIDPGLGLRPPTTVELAVAVVLLSGARRLRLDAVSQPAARRLRPLVVPVARTFPVRPLSTHRRGERAPHVPRQRRLVRRRRRPLGGLRGASRRTTGRAEVRHRRRRSLGHRHGAAQLRLPERHGAVGEHGPGVSAANPRAFNNLGVAYESNGRTGEARTAYARAVALEPRYALARKNLERVEQRTP